MVGGVSLREAVAVAGTPGFDPAINFASNLNPGRITLTLGEIQFSKNLTIDGTGRNITIDANGDSNNELRIFNITDTTSGSAPPLVTLKGLNLTGGYIDVGGAIRSAGLLAIIDCTIEGNEALSGGAIFVNVLGGNTSTAREVLRIEGSTIAGNFAFEGAGVHVVAGSSSNAVADTIWIGADTTIENNDTYDQTGAGGGLFLQAFGADTTIDDSTFRLNSGTSGGGGIHAQLFAYQWRHLPQQHGYRADQ